MWRQDVALHPRQVKKQVISDVFKQLSALDAGKTQTPGKDSH